MPEFIGQISALMQTELHKYRKGVTILCVTTLLSFWSILLYKACYYLVGINLSHSRYVCG